MECRGTANFVVEYYDINIISNAKQWAVNTSEVINARYETYNPEKAFANYGPYMQVAYAAICGRIAAGGELFAGGPFAAGLIAGGLFDSGLNAAPPLVTRIITSDCARYIILPHIWPSRWPQQNAWLTEV